MPQRLNSKDEATRSVLPVSADVIQWARLRSGRSFDDLAKHLPKLSEWEGGRSAPTFKELEELANRTHTPLGNFFLKSAPKIDLSISDFRTLRDAYIANPSANLVETIEACTARQQWYREYAIANGLEPVEVLGVLTEQSDVASAGHTLRGMLDFEVDNRSKLSILDETYRYLSESLDALGVLVMKNSVVGLNTHRKLDPEEFRGFALYDDYAPLIFVNGADVKAGHIFTLCHEFVHLALGQSALTNSPTPERDVDDRYGGAAERWCNRVAAEILVPEADLRHQFDTSRPLDTEIHRLSRRYKASKYVVLHSLKDTDRISWQEFLGAYQSLKDAWGESPPIKRSGGGDFYRNQVVRLGRRLSMALVSDTLEGRTLYADAYRLLGTKKPSTFARFAKELGL
jgi:Zn-dependent peptidase ImmA (M78 family)